MCGAPAVAAGATIVSTGLTIADRMSQRGTAVDNRQAAINAALNETIPSINQSLAQVYNSNAARTNQEQDKAAVEKFDILRGMAEAKGTATAAAGDAGVGGVSFAHILSDFETREALAKGNIDYNVTAKSQQIADENEANRTKAKGAINSAINQAVAGTPVPSGTAMWAGIGADTIGAGLKIGDRLGLFDKDKTADKPNLKVDPATGRAYGTDSGTWS